MGSGACPHTQMVSHREGRTDAPPQPRSKQLRFYISPRNNPRIFSSNKQKNCNQITVSSGPFCDRGSTLKADLQSGIIAPKHGWTSTHTVSASLVRQLVYVLKHVSILRGNVTPKHTQPKKVMTSGNNFISSG